MKHLFIAVLGISIVFSQSAFARELPVSSTVLQSFYASFGTSAKVVWNEFKGIYKASFNYNGKQLIAYYNAAGENIAMADYLSFNELPYELQIKLEEKMIGNKLVDIFEVRTEEGNSYFVTLENEKEIIVLQSISGSWKFFKKTAK
ncbi:MAG TPA: hypothetical protein VGO09_09380 [Flavisolibacter sp.]|nr:hypothetical protein [Flavisolibacter sp.]